jgi:cAMP-dependent protein kinase regulator
VILQLDPTHDEAQTQLAELYSKRAAAKPAEQQRASEAPADSDSMEIERGVGRYDAIDLSPEPEAKPSAAPPAELEIQMSSLLLPGPNPKQLPAAPAEIELDVSALQGTAFDGEEIPIIVDPEPIAPVPANLPVIPLFSDLSREDFIAVLQGAAEVRAFNRGEPIVKEGEPGDAMYAIVQGKVAVVRQVEGEAPKKVAQMNEGDLFGEMALISNSPRLATVVAEEETVVMEFARQSLDGIAAKHPSVRTAIERFYRQRLLENLLRSSPLLHPLSHDQKRAVARQFEAKNYPSGEVLLKQGAPGEAFFMLLRGRCEVFHTAKTGGEFPYPDLREGDAFGEISVLLEQAATATVRAKGPVVVLKMAAAKFRELMLAHPEVKPLVMKLVNERLGRTAELAGKLRGIGRDLRV